MLHPLGVLDHEGQVAGYGPQTRQARQALRRFSTAVSIVTIVAPQTVQMHSAARQLLHCQCRTSLADPGAFLNDVAKNFTYHCEILVGTNDDKTVQTFDIFCGRAEGVGELGIDESVIIGRTYVYGLPAWVGRGVPI